MKKSFFYKYRQTSWSLPQVNDSCLTFQPTVVCDDIKVVLAFLLFKQHPPLCSVIIKQVLYIDQTELDIMMTCIIFYLIPIQIYFDVKALPDWQLIFFFRQVLVPWFQNRAKANCWRSSTRLSGSLYCCFTWLRWVLPCLRAWSAVRSIR